MARSRLLVLGASGMLGRALVHEFLGDKTLETLATVRSAESLPIGLRDRLGERLLVGVDVTNQQHVRGLIERVRPNWVINAVGVVKQSSQLDDNVATVEINALLPHLLARECSRTGGRLIHVSTDCVFSGRKGRYDEEDVPDPVDFYGRSKLLGEVDSPHLTLRTSIIGHELARHGSLLDWFLGQRGKVHGYTGAIYSGLTTVEFAKFCHEVVIQSHLAGIYHLASDPISKYDLLALIADTYAWSGTLERDEVFTCDRSMRAERLQAETGYVPPAWPEMIETMHRSLSKWKSIESGNES